MIWYTSRYGWYDNDHGGLLVYCKSLGYFEDHVHS